MPNSAKIEKGCRFCGNPFSVSPKTEEHVPPKWLLEFAGVKRNEKHHLLQRAAASEYSLIRKIGAHSCVYGKVCNACNSGWLSNLENEMKIVFSKMTANNQFNLNIDEARVLCRWMHKTAALIALSNPGPRKYLIVDEDLKALYRGELPTGTSDVILGRTSVPAPSKLRIWTHGIRYGVPHGHNLEDEMRNGKCFTAMLHFKNILIGYIYRFPSEKWTTRIEPQEVEFMHIWPGHLLHEIDMASVSPIDDPEAIRFSFLLMPTQHR